MTGEKMLQEMYQSMITITDPYLWGEYAFSRDILQNRIEEKEKREMIQQAVTCGRDYARLIMSQYEGHSIMNIMDTFSIKLINSEESIIGERILFAQYTPPDEVVIMEEPLKRYEAMLTQMNLTEILPSTKQVRQLLLGHELFHWIEEKYQDSIYTRKKKLTLWKLWKFENQSIIRALGELAAMYFSQKLNQVTYSPFLLDVLLSYSYNEEIACSIYKDIMKITGNEKKEGKL